MADYAQVETALALMVLQDEFYFPTPERVYSYFIKLPSEWENISADELNARATKVLQDVYAAHYDHFRRAEPDDLNYIAVRWVAAQRLLPDAVAQKVWLTAVPPHWESSPCLEVDAEGSFEKVNPQTF